MKHVESGRAIARKLFNAPCLRCSRPAGCVGQPTRGYCKSCYTVLHKKGELPRSRKAIGVELKASYYRQAEKNVQVAYEGKRDEEQHAIEFEVA